MSHDINEIDEDEIWKEDDVHLEFRDEFDALDSGEKGSWGERAVIKEADEAGHVILIDHWDKPTASGFDCVSLDPETGELHIWEAKNFGNHAVDSEKLSAWKDLGRDEKPWEGFKENWDAVVSSVPEGPVRDAVKQAINEGKVHYHLRLGAETRISPELQTELDEANVPGAKYDWKRYSHEYMLRAGSKRAG